MAALSTPGRQHQRAYKRVSGRASRWLTAFVCVLFCPAALLAMPDRFYKGPLAGAAGAAFFVLLILLLLYGSYVAQQDRADLLAAPLDATEVEYLPVYIMAFASDGEKVHERASRILCELLGRMSEDELADLPEDCWCRLCPPPKITPTGYSFGERVGPDDPVHAAAFSAITRLKRMKSLPLIESWMQHLDPERHSEAYTRALTECYETLQNLRDAAQQSATLLRASSLEATPATLLRPIAATSLSETDTGEQLLRASQE